MTILNTTQPYVTLHGVFYYTDLYTAYYYTEYYTLRLPLGLERMLWSEMAFHSSLVPSIAPDTCQTPKISLNEPMSLRNGSFHKYKNRVSEPGLDCGKQELLGWFL